MGGKRLQRIGAFRVVVLEEEVSDSIIQCIVKTSFTLESISFAESAGLEEQFHDFVMPAKACLDQQSGIAAGGAESACT
jgi:hypothetical protein